MKSYVVVGLGYGDEGKGATVDFLCDQFKADYVVKYSGGHQAGHRVVVGDKQHVFSQYGSGAIAGVPTYLDRDFIIEPMAMAAERSALVKLGANVEIGINPNCPVTTRYHRAFNRLGGGGATCGLGIGATRVTDNIGIGLVHCELHHGVYRVEEKVRRIRSYLLSEAKRKDESCYTDEWFMNEMNVSPMQVAGELVEARLECHDTFEYPMSGTIVFEGSQGVLLDETYGDRFATYSTVTPRNAFEYPGFDRSNAVVVGVMRTYLTRHGDGPFASNAELCSDPNNQFNEWQGNMRRCQWSTTIRRSLSIAKPDVVAMNHCDEQPSPDVGCAVLVESTGPDRSDRVIMADEIRKSLSDSRKPTGI